MRTHVALAVALPLVLASSAAAAATLTVGPGKTYAKPCAAIAAAKAGDTIEVDAGSYDGDTCAWDTDNLTVKGVGGRATIHTTAPVGNKGIFTITAANATIENFEFSGAVSSDSNGAGIRHQGLNLTVRGSYFHDNEDGILGSPAKDKGATAQPGQGSVTIEGCEFANNGAGDGQSHNMYIGNYGTFTLHGSYTHGAKKGQLVKSRAYVSFLLYNRITDEAGTTASYEVDLPNGGTSYLVGNLIEQSAASENDNIIETGAEGVKNPTNHLYVVSNTIVNDYGKGTFVLDAAGTTPTTIANNIFVGKGTITNAASPTLVANWDDTMGDPMLVDKASYDYHLAAASPCIDKGGDPGTAPGLSLNPVEQYVHPLATEGRKIAGAAIDIGAYEVGGATSLPDGGTSDGGATTSDGGTTGGDDGGGATTTRADGGDDANASGDDGGCGCVVEGRASDRSALGGLLAALGVLVARRRRRSVERRS